MENERELLELAAKACGLDLEWCEFWQCMAKNLGVIDGFDRDTCWNPRADDGDCARMEAALGIYVSWTRGYVMADHDSLIDCMIEPFNPHNGDKQAARRMASLRVAAEIGRAMQSDER